MQGEKSIYARYDSGNYRTPTIDEIRDFQKSHELSGGDIARITGVKNDRVRYWMTKNPRAWKEIPYSCWRLLLIETGEIKELHLCSQ